MFLKLSIESIVLKAKTKTVNFFIENNILVFFFKSAKTMKNIRHKCTKNDSVRKTARCCKSIEKFN